MVASWDLDRRLLKQVHDNVHGDIFLDNICLKFIDTQQFQRLRDLKQLGVAHTVYPGAVHTRFEHSLGVYWLAGETINKIAKYQGAELDIDRNDIKTVKLAGLLHDVGHGPFSRLYECEFLPKLGQTWSHEEMSATMIDYIVDEHNIDVEPAILAGVKEMITASSEHGPGKVSNHKSVREKSFLYEIVANGCTGIDIDKFDYIVRDTRACGVACNFQFERLMDTMRVMDDEICYHANDYLTINKLFATHADLHRTVYTHAKVKAIELMILDALVEASYSVNLVSKIHDPAWFWQLDDLFLKTIEMSSLKSLKESRDLIKRIRKRDLYQFCNEFYVPKESLDHFKDITTQDIVCSQKSGGVKLKEEDVAVSNIKIDLTCGGKNPFRRINFFQDYESNEKFQIKDYGEKYLPPSYYQDMIVRVYSKKSHLVEAVSEAFENFQRKIFGETKQVYANPEKKRWR